MTKIVRVEPKAEASLPTPSWPAEPIPLLEACLDHPDQDYARGVLAERVTTDLENGKAGLNLTEVDLSGRRLNGYDLRGSVLNRGALYGADLSRARLDGASLICVGTERARFAGASLRGAYLHGFAAQVCNFNGADLSQLADATGSMFHGCKLVGADLSASSLSGTTFYQCDLTGASFKGTDLQGVTFAECLLRETDMRGAHLGQGRIVRSAVEGADLSGASGDHFALLQLSRCDGLSLNGSRLPGLTIQDCTINQLDGRNLFGPDSIVRNAGLNDVQLLGADMKRTSWMNVHGSKCIIDGAVFTQAAWREVTIRDLSAKGTIAESAHFVDCNLDGAVLDGIKGRTLVMRDCSLAGASLRGAYLYRAYLSGDVPARLCFRNADLSDAILVQSYIAGDFSDARLANANLTYARLNQTDFRRANLSNAGFFQASMVKTDMSGAAIAGISPPFFADRVEGLSRAVDELTDAEERERLAEFLKGFDLALAGAVRGST